MELQITHLAEFSKENTSLQVADEVFGQSFNETLVHQVVTAYLATGRAGTRAQKTRSEVSGGGIKPWRQKGTGRARAGTIRSPLWRKGGIVFAAKPQDFTQKVNKKMYRAAIRSIVSELIRQERIKVVEQLVVEHPKTKLFINLLKEIGINNIDSKTILVLDDGIKDNLELSARNLPNFMVCDACSVDPVTLIKYETVIMTIAAVKRMEERLV